MTVLGASMRTIERGRDGNRSWRPAFLASAQSNRERAFAAHVETIYRFFWSHVGNREDAEDLTSQVLRSSAHLLSTARMNAETSDAIKTASVAVLADYRRRNYGDADRDLTRENESLPNRRRSTSDILTALPAQHREALELCLLRDYAPEEAARKLGVSIDVLRNLQRQALARAARADPPE
jgi:DNA-directed RNA polymerase specialized sigma24 family protein